ncbi:MAG: TIGR00282 family metallophosphoesterase [Candidatus Saccharimonadales bacterium]
MRLLYIGDIMGNLGVQVIRKVLAELKDKENIDIVAAQSENITEGKGISLKDLVQLQTIGIDFFTGGNWSLSQPDILESINDPNQPIIRPANYPKGTPGLGYKYLDTQEGKILFVSLLGQIVGKDSDKPVDNPLKTVDNILESEKTTPKIATIVNFHGDYSSEKVVIGQYLDGRVTAVVGDHWHVPTADARILPKGTAHITDVGMCGALNSSLGVKLSVIVNRWRDGIKLRNELETIGPCQFNSVLIDIDKKTGLAINIRQIQLQLDI